MLGLVLLLAVVDWGGVAASTLKSIVMIENADGTCTGFVIASKAKDDQDYILTAAHCDGDKLYADHEAAKVVWKDKKADLMILAVDDTGRPPLKLAAADPVIGQEVSSYGFGMGLERPMFRVAHISDTDANLPDVEGGPFLMIDAAFVGGMSGGPVVDEYGAVVMIVQRASGTVGIGLGAEKIRDKTGRYWEIKP